MDDEDDKQALLFRSTMLETTQSCCAQRLTYAFYDGNLTVTHYIHPVAPLTDLARNNRPIAPGLSTLQCCKVKNKHATLERRPLSNRSDGVEGVLQHFLRVHEQCMHPTKKIAL
jgi:hypothetical protein